MTALESLEAAAFRHGILPVRYPQSRKALNHQYRIFDTTEHQYCSRRSWRTLVRIWLKITLSGDGVLESIEGIEIPPGSQPSAIKSGSPLEPDVRWVEKPPVKLYQLKQIIEAGIGLAEASVSKEAGDLQNRQLRNRFPALARMRIYYRQLTADAAGSGGDEIDAIEAEYQRRLREEIRYTRVRATLKLIALETISTPVQELNWVLQRNREIRKIRAVIDLSTGRLLTPVQCDICRTETGAFGLSESNRLVCASCRLQPDIGNAQMAARKTDSGCCIGCRERYPADRIAPCSFCGQKVCMNCRQHCRACGRTYCLRHIAGGICRSCRKANNQTMLFQDRQSSNPK